METENEQKCHFDGLDPDNATKHTLADVGYQLIRAGLGVGTDAAVAGHVDIGGAATAVLDLAVTPILHRRFERFIKGLFDGCKKLEKDVKGIQDKLAEDGQLVSVLVQAARSAAATHREEKREALRNAVLNTYLNPGDEDQELFFLGLIDQLVPAEIRILKNLSDPEALAAELYHGGQRMNGNDLTQLLVAQIGGHWQYRFTEIYGYLTRDSTTQAEREAFGSFLQHLFSLGLVIELNDYGTDTAIANLFISGSTPSLVTTLGWHFLEYISEPAGAEKQADC